MDWSTNTEIAVIQHPLMESRPLYRNGISEINNIYQMIKFCLLLHIIITGSLRESDYLDGKSTMTHLVFFKMSCGTNFSRASCETLNPTG